MSDGSYRFGQTFVNFSAVADLEGASTYYMVARIMLRGKEKSSLLYHIEYERSGYTPAMESGTDAV